MDRGPAYEAIIESNMAAQYVPTSQVIYSGLASIIVLAVERGTRLEVGIKVAMKAQFNDDDERLRVLSEVELHRAVPPHANVTRLLVGEETPQAILLATPYTPHGDLWELVRYGQTYCEPEVRNCSAQIFAALRHIHTVCDLVHGDMKPHNLLLFQVDDKFVVQLCDFGLAQHPDSGVGGTVTFRGLRGTSGWFSPEVLAGRDYGFAADVFSTGLILFRMLGGYAPYDPPSKIGAVEFDDRYWCHTSSACRSFLAQVLAEDPDARGTTSALCAHEWLQNGPPAEPTPEQLTAISKFGPPPCTNVRFWPVDEVPDTVESTNSFAKSEAAENGT